MRRRSGEEGLKSARKKNENDEEAGAADGATRACAVWDGTVGCGAAGWRISGHSFCALSSAAASITVGSGGGGAEGRRGAHQQNKKTTKRVFITLAHIAPTAERGQHA